LFRLRFFVFVVLPREKKDDKLQMIPIGQHKERENNGPQLLLFFGGVSFVFVYLFVFGVFFISFFKIFF
jgi:hypothetical protein